MSIMTSTSADQKEVTIYVQGRFDFSLVQDFRNAYSDKDPHAIYTIDLAKTDYLDSSALGMLIHLWKFTGENKNNVRIINSNEEIRKIFDITHFDKNFTIV